MKYFWLIMAIFSGILIIYRWITFSQWSDSLALWVLIDLIFFEIENLKIKIDKK